MQGSAITYRNWVSMRVLPEEGFWMPPAPPTAMQAASPAPSKALQGLAPPAKQLQLQMERGGGRQQQLGCSGKGGRIRAGDVPMTLQTRAKAAEGRSKREPVGSQVDLHALQENCLAEFKIQAKSYLRGLETDGRKY